MAGTEAPSRLAVVLSHPTQYYSPWFRHLANRSGLTLKVFYLWDFGVRETRDRTFETSFVWDVPLLEGYDHAFLPNVAADPGTHHLRGLDNPGAASAVAEWRPDAVLMFGYAYLTHLRLMVAPSLARIPFLFRGDSHELCPATGWRSQVSRRLRGILFRRFAAFLAVGSANAAYFRASGVPQERIRIVPHCVDNDRFQSAAPRVLDEAAKWRVELGIPPEATVILFAGKFESKKRPLELLRAFQEVVREGTNHTAENHVQVDGWEQDGPPTPASDPGSPKAASRRPSPCLFFVGSGPLESELRTAAATETGRSVFFAPFQNQSAMPKVYAAGDILVLPSQGRGETWGLAINEAMNLERPAIVSSHVGCGPDLIIDGETGWSFPAGDTEGLREALSKALAEPALLKSMGRNARNHIAGFSYDRATEALMEALKESEARSLIGS